MPEPVRSPVATKRSFLWNMMGSSMNAASTLLLTMFVTRVCGTEDAGILSIAISVSFVLVTVGNFEVRPYQSTDIDRRFSFSTYLAFRLITCSVMVVLAVLYVTVYGAAIGYSPYKSAIILIICLYRMLGALSDVFQGLFQQHERMDWAGKALFLYVAASVVLFLIVLFLTKQLLWASVSMLAAVLVSLLLFDFRHARQITDVRPKWHLASIRSLCFACIPLFLAYFMNIYENNAAKFQLDAYFPELQAIWTPLFMPAFVINLFCFFVFRPLLTSLTSDWNQDRLRMFVTRIGKLLLLIVAITVACLVLGFFLGIPVLQLLYGLDLSSYRSILMLVLVGGGCNTVSVLLFYVVTIMRKQKVLLLCEAGAFATALVLTPILIQHYTLLGAALSYICIMIVRSLLFASVALWQYRKKKRGLKSIVA